MNSFNSWRTVSDFKIRDQIIHSIIVKGLQTDFFLLFTSVGLSQRQEGKPISEGRDPPHPMRRPQETDGMSRKI